MKLKTCAGILSISFVGFVVTGCFLGPKEKDDFNDAADGNAGAVSYEMSSMGNFVADSLDPSPTLAKSMGATSETLFVDVEVKPYQYNATTKGWVRSAVAHATVNGTAYTRTRNDTIWFMDVHGDTLVSDVKPTLAMVDHYTHVRSVNSDYPRIHQHTFHMDVVISQTGTLPVFTYNGQITGTYDGQTFRSTTIDGVKRTRENHHNGFPTEGSIHVEHLLRTIDIVFTGNNTATATVTRKRDGATKVITVNIATAEEN